MRTYRVTMDGGRPSEAALWKMIKEQPWAPYPRASDRAAWRRLAARAWLKPKMPRLIRAAEKALSKPPSLMRATDYLAYTRLGIRTPHGASAGPRRSRLTVFVAAECVEHKGRFLDAILDESWLIAEETSWVASPHVWMSRSGWPLPDAECPTIDLSAAHTAHLVGQALYLLGAEMDAITPLWRKRMNYEIRRRIVEPYLSEHFWWEEAEMNWNPVCQCGVAASVLHSDLDPLIKARVMRRVIGEAPAFLRGFTADGGCTEGPGYWVYGVSYYVALAYYVHCMSGGAIDMLADPMCRPVMDYPTKMVLSGDQVVAFADSGLDGTFGNGGIMWAAQRLEAKEMAALASAGRQPRPFETDPLDMVLWGEGGEFRPHRDAWLPELQVMNCRGRGREGRQLVLAAKGGNNAEVHNHNDVGNFIVHWRGESLICELGVGDYIQKTFSERRYELLFTRSLGHNVPLVNGVEQAAGERFHARDVSFEAGDEKATLSMELAGAYPRSAGLKGLVRTLTLNRGKDECVELEDRVSFSGPQRLYELPLYSVGRFRKAGRGKVLAEGKKGALAVEFDPQEMQVRIEEVNHGDQRLSTTFGAKIRRCIFKLKGPAAQACARLRFVPRGR